MRIVMMEDEAPAARRLGKMIGEALPGAVIEACLPSIAAAEEWFAINPQPQLIFLDIHLSDGSAFDLLQRVHLTAPIIFTTAYDQYAIEAFKTKSIGYLLKPIKVEDLQHALEKLAGFKSFFDTGNTGQKASVPQEYKKRFVIRIGEQLKTLPVEDIAYCYAQSKVTFARSFAGRNYPMDHNLDTLEAMLDPRLFFRINRQYLISLGAIEEMRTYTKSRVVVKLKLPVKDEPVVSAERAHDFKRWLGGDV